MGLDVTDKLLCYFVMALGNDGLTHLTIKSYLSAVHWPGSRIQRVPRACGTSKGTRPLCLLLGALYDWAVPSHHTPKHGATMLTTIPGAWPMIDNSGRRLTSINNTMSCSNDDDLIFYLCKENVLLWLLNHHFLFLMCSLIGCFKEEEWDRTLLGDLLIKAPHLESLE